MKTLEARELTKSYGRRVVVQQVGLKVSEGEVVGLLGPNGAGKTTTFYMVVGLARPDSGRVFLGGDEITATARRFRFRGDRGYVRRLSALAALQMLRLDLLGVLDQKVHRPVQRMHLHLIQPVDGDMLAHPTLHRELGPGIQSAVSYHGEKQPLHVNLIPALPEKSSERLVEF